MPACRPRCGPKAWLGQAALFSVALVGLLIFVWLAVPTEQTLDLKFPNVGRPGLSRTV